MTMQTDLRAAATLLTQAADHIDGLESQIGPLEARVTDLEGVLGQIRDLAVGVVGASGVV